MAHYVAAETCSRPRDPEEWHSVLSVARLGEQRLQNIGEIPLSCKRLVNSVQRGSVGGTYPSQNH